MTVGAGGLPVPMADDDVFEVNPETAGAAGFSTRAPVSLPAASGVDTRRGGRLSRCS